MAFEYKLSNIVSGGLIYSAGDTIAVLITNGFDFGDLNYVRVLGVFMIGATLYALEIPNFFNWIDKKVPQNGSKKNDMLRAVWATLFFNPLWIARHILLIQLVSGNYSTIAWSILMTGLISFVVNIPVAFVANYWIQNKVSVKNRFVVSSVFSGIMAIYYSLSETWY